VIRRIEQHQQTLVNWLLPADQNPAGRPRSGTSRPRSRSTASVAASEPDPYMAAVFRFGLLEDFDHLYRFLGADGIAWRGKDAAAILQGYTDILPGRPTAVEHRQPASTIFREPYDRDSRRSAQQAARADDHGGRETRPMTST